MPTNTINTKKGPFLAVTIASKHYTHLLCRGDGQEEGLNCASCVYLVSRHLRIYFPSSSPAYSNIPRGTVRKSSCNRPTNTIVRTNLHRSGKSPRHPIPISCFPFLGLTAVKVTAWWNFAARSILREAYTHFSVDNGDLVTIRFVVGLPREDEHGMMDLLQWEQERFGDLQVLNQRENMNEGKTFEYFSSLARMYPIDDPAQRPYDYAMKADDDTFVNIPLLLERLRPMTPREETYMVSSCKLSAGR